MSDERVDHVPFMPEVWLVPANLADLECRHGNLPGECAECDRLDRVKLADGMTVMLMERVAEVVGCEVCGETEDVWLVHGRNLCVTHVDEWDES